MDVEKPADQQVGFLRSAMMGAPSEALKVRIGWHCGHVVIAAPHCERQNSR
jgi:hypothetical protein